MKKEKQELVVVDHKEFGLEESVASGVKECFIPMLTKMEELESTFNKVIKLDPESPEASKQARELRLEYVKVRTGTAKIHKEQKAFYLAGGRFVDGWKNAQAFASQGKEEKLKEIEDYAEIQAQKVIEELQEFRAGLLAPFLSEGENVPGDLGQMSNDFWSNFIKGAEMTHNERIEAAEAAEKERIRAEKEQALHDERKEKLLDYWTFMDDEQKTLRYGSMSKSDWDKLLVTLIKAKKTEDDRLVALEKENAKQATAIAEQQKQKDKEDARMKSLTNMGLVFNGESFVFEGINFHWTDIKTFTDEKFDEAFEGAKKRMVVIQKEKEQAEESAVKKLRDEQDNKVSGFMSSLEQNGFSVQDDGSLRNGKLVVTYERLYAMTEEEFETRLAEIKEVLSARGIPAATTSGIYIPGIEFHPTEATLDNLIADLESVKTKYTFTNANDKKVYSSTGKLIDKIITYINEKKNG